MCKSQACATQLKKRIKENKIKRKKWSIRYYDCVVDTILAVSRVQIIIIFKKLLLNQNLSEENINCARLWFIHLVRKHSIVLNQKENYNQCKKSNLFFKIYLSEIEMYNIRTRPGEDITKLLDCMHESFKLKLTNTEHFKQEKKVYTVNQH